MHGEGVWSGRGEHYEGSFRAGLRDGMGSLKRADGAAYSGASAHALSLAPSRSCSRAGGFAAHRFHGEGTLRLADGSVYEGEFTAGARSGRGSWRRGDEEYAGPWAGDRPHGEGGVWRGEGGAVGYTGRWERGVPTERAASLRLLVAREHAPAEAKKAQTPASKKAPPTEPADPAQQLDPALAPLAAAGDAAPLKCAPGEPLCPSLCARLLTSSGATLASAERGRTLRVWLEQREAPGKPAVGFESPASAGDTAAAVDLERVIQVDGGCGDLGALTLASGAAPGSQLLLCVRANELARPGSLLFTGDGPIEARYPLLVGPAAKRKPTAAAAAGAAGRKQ
jgi:hypothetical protein